MTRGRHVPLATTDFTALPRVATCILVLCWLYIHAFVHMTNLPGRHPQLDGVPWSAFRVAISVGGLGGLISLCATGAQVYRAIRQGNTLRTGDILLPGILAVLMGAYVYLAWLD